MFRKIAFPLAAAAGALVLILVSVPLKGQRTGDYLADAGPVLLGLDERSGNWRRLPVPYEAPERSLWRVPFSSVDGAYVLGPTPDAVSFARGAEEGTLEVTLDSASGSAFVVSGQDPFIRYSVSDAARTFSLKFLRGGAVSVSFAKSAAGKPEARIYPYNAVVSLQILRDGRAVAASDVYPGTLVRYDPATAGSLEGADALRVSQVAQFASFDFAAPEFSKTAFGANAAVLGDAFMSDLGAQVSALANEARQQKTRRFDVASTDSAALLNPSKKAFSLQNELLEMLSRDDVNLTGKVKGTLSRLSELGPQFEASGRGLVREFYLPYWFSGVLSGDREVLLGTDKFTVSMRDIYGCRMASKYFAGISNPFATLLFQHAAGAAAPKRPLTRAEFEDGLAAYVRTREAPGDAVAATGSAQVRKDGFCGDQEVPTEAGYRSLWAFALQYLERPGILENPLPSTLALAKQAVEKGSVRFGLMSKAPFEARKTEVQFTMLSYQKIFRALLASVEKVFFSSRSPYVFSDEATRGGEMQVDRSLINGLDALSSALSAAPDAFFPASDVMGAPIESVRVFRSLVESKFRPETVTPIAYVNCVVQKERAYRFPEPGDTPVCSELLPPGFKGPDPVPAAAAPAEIPAPALPAARPNRPLPPALSGATAPFPPGTAAPLPPAPRPLFPSFR